jgi:predicted Zn-dependent peptidase
MADGTIEQMRTSNGIPVIVSPLRGARAVAVSLTIMTGSRDDPPREAGMAHFLEHMFFKGSMEHDCKYINERVEDAGGYLNAFTTTEQTTYYGFIIDETRKVAMDLIAEMITQPRFDALHIESEKQVVKQEINSRVNDPDRNVRSLLMRDMFGKHPMGRMVLGTRKTVQSLDRGSILEHYSKHYVPANMAIVATGNVEPREVLEWSESSFGGLPPGGCRGKRIPPSIRARTVLHRREGDHAFVALGWPGRSAIDDESYALAVLTTVMSGGMSSRLMHRIREKEGLVYSIGMSSPNFSDSGTVECGFSTTQEKAVRVLELAAEEIRTIKAEGLRPGELDRAKMVVKGNVLRSKGQPNSEFLALVYSQAKIGRPMTAEEDLQRILDVTEEQVRAAASLLHRPMMSAAVHTDEKGGAAVLEAVQAMDY